LGNPHKRLGNPARARHNKAKSKSSDTFLRNANLPVSPEYISADGIVYCEGKVGICTFWRQSTL